MNKEPFSRQQLFVRVLLVITLILLSVLGFFCHATGDDYVLSFLAHRAYERGDHLFGILAAAAEGTSLEYYRWQGTYTAMFLMQLAPNAFSEKLYVLVPILLLALFVFGSYYFFRYFFVQVFQATDLQADLITVSLIVFSLNIMPYLSDSIYWYNGGLYYTGFYALTLMLYGVLLRLWYTKRTGYLMIAIVLGLLIGGANYVSQMPLLIVLMLTTVIMFFRNQKHADCQKFILGCSLTLFAQLLSLGVSILAPGNLVRADGSFSVPAWKAIAKSLLTGISLLTGWIDLWWIVLLCFLLPVFVAVYRRTNVIFRYPFLVIPVIYCLFCSQMTPTFYAQNTTGPIRILAVYYYNLITNFYFCIFYLGGWIYQKGCRRTLRMPRFTQICNISAITLTILTLLLGGLRDLNAYEAARELISGEASAYRQEYLARMAVLNDETQQDVVLPAYVTQPKLIHVGDFQADKNANYTVSLYFHKHSISVDFSAQNGD